MNGCYEMRRFVTGSVGVRRCCAALEYVRVIWLWIPRIFPMADQNLAGAGKTVMRSVVSQLSTRGRPDH